MQRVGEYHIAGASTTQHVVLVGEEGTHGYRTGSLVNDSADCLHAATVGIHGSVDELQLYIRHLFQNCLGATAFTTLCQELACGHGEVGVDVGDVGNGSQRVG